MRKTALHPILTIALVVAMPIVAAAQADAEATPPEETPPEDTAAAADEEPATVDATPAAEEELPAAEEELPADDMFADDGMDIEALDLGELLNMEVSSATKTEMRSFDAPSNITVITAKDIRRWGYRSLVDILHYELGFNIIDDHIIPDTGVRGIAGGLRSESGNIKLMIDGHSIGYRFTGGNWLGVEAIPLSAISQIEIVRGPASALYGADAFLGVINIITHQKSGPGEVSVVGNSYGDNLGLDADLTLRGSSGAFDVVASARLDRSNRAGLAIPESSPAANLLLEGQTEARELLHDSEVAYAKLRYWLDDAREKTSITLSGYTARIERDGEFAEWAQMTNNLDAAGYANRTVISRENSALLLDAEHELNDQWRFWLSGTLFSGGDREASRIEINNPNLYVKNRSSFMGFDAALGAVWSPLDTLTNVIQVDAALDQEKLPLARYVVRTPSGQLAPGSRIRLTDEERREENLVNAGGLLQSTWQAVERYLMVTAGGRYDYHNIYGSQLSGRVGIVSNPVDWAGVKLLYGNAFKAPSPQLLYAVPFAAGDVVGNEDLAPQRVHSFELQAGFDVLEYAHITTDVSYNYLTDKAEFVLQGLNKTAQNVAEVETIAWETSIDAAYETWLRGFARLELVFGARNSGAEGYRQRLLGSEIRAYPGMQFKAGVWGGVPGIPLRASAQVRYVGSSHASDTNTVENGASYQLDSYLVVDATLSTHQLELFGSHDTTLELIVRNIADTKATVPGYSGIDLPYHPRTIMVLLRQEFSLSDE